MSKSSPPFLLKIVSIANSVYLYFMSKSSVGQRALFSSSGVTHPAAFASALGTREVVSVDNSSGESPFNIRKRQWCNHLNYLNRSGKKMDSRGKNRVGGGKK